MYQEPIFAFVLHSVTILTIVEPLWGYSCEKENSGRVNFCPQRFFFDSEFGWKSPFSEWKEFCLANNNVVGSNLGYKLERAAHFSSFQARVFCQGIWTSCFELILPHEEFEALLAHQEKPSFGLLKSFWAFAFKAWLVKLLNEPLSLRTSMTEL